MPLVNQNYFMFLIISLNASQRTSALCQATDAENFVEVFTALIPFNILAKSSVS